jgi:hypothetical protein
MTDETDQFLNATQAAERICESLTDLARQTENYSEAGRRLESATEGITAHTEATIRMFAEQDRRWDELEQLLDTRVNPSLDRINDSAEKQASHLSSLAGVAASQQTQLTLVQQDITANTRLIIEMKSSLDRLEETSGRQSETLQLQSVVLEQIQQGVRKATRSTRNATYIAALAALLSLAALVVLIAYLAT